MQLEKPAPAVSPFVGLVGLHVDDFFFRFFKLEIQNIIIITLTRKLFDLLKLSLINKTKQTPAEP